MKCNSCNGLGFYPVTGYQMWMQMDCSQEARRCPVCNGLGATVERLPYQGPDSPEYKERIKSDPLSQQEVYLTEEEKDQLGIVSYAPWRKPVWFP